MMAGIALETALRAFASRDGHETEGGIVMRKVFAVACVLAVLLAVPAAADPWTKYENDRFGYSVEYPDIFSEMKEPENGDGVWL